jgi:hypothetical protein
VKPTVSEASWLSVVLELARWHGWLAFHPLPAQNGRGQWRTAQAGDTGFPDLVLVHPDRGIIFAELKTAIGRLTDQQTRWLAALKAAGAEAYVWRPADLPEIKAILKEGNK